MFIALGTHTYLAVGLAVASALTVFIISWSYSRIIERFPFGGGGYVVATKLLGPSAGVVSGSALMIDYVLTITTSIAAGGDAIFSLYPQWASWKLISEFSVIGVLVLMNLRGVKESVTVLAPVFVLFLLTHAVLILGTVGSRAAEIPEVFAEVKTGRGLSDGGRHRGGGGGREAVRRGSRSAAAAASGAVIPSPYRQRPSTAPVLARHSGNLRLARASSVVARSGPFWSNDAPL